MACFSVLAYLCVLDCFSVLAYFCVLTYLRYLTCLSVLAYFCVLAYFSNLACLSVLAYFSNLACWRYFAYLCVLDCLIFLSDLLDLNDDSVQGNLFSTLRTCVRNVKDPSKIACTTSRCPCNKQSQACSRKCRCYNCKNENITKFVGLSGIETRRQNGGPCACGINSKKEDTDRVSCKDGKRKRSVHVLRRVSDAPKSANAATAEITIQTGGVSTVLGTGRKRRRETVSSYKRKCGTECLTGQIFPVTQGPWRLMETLCLIVFKELLVFNELPINSVNVGTLYNLSLIIARKSTAQVGAKIKHLTKT